MASEPFEWVDSAAALDAAAARWQRAPALGVDTEFVRERTFYPRLGLLQISDGVRPTLLDPLALGDLEPLRAVLADPRILKVVHSPSEDLEVLYHRFGEFPAPLFDTQVAAAIAGLEASMSYQRLVRELLGVELAKGETRTDWLQRPLSPSQLEYAAQDVEFLLPLHRALQPRLEQAGRAGWVVEESRRLRDPLRFLPAPEEAYLRLGGLGGLDRRQLAVLRALAAWREQQARERDLPRNFVLKESTLIALARRQPQRPAELAEIPDLAPRQSQRLGNTLLRLVHEARELPPEQQPSPLPRGARDERGREVLDQLQEKTRERAVALAIAPTVLASRRDLKQLLNTPREALPPAALGGWRWDALAAALVPVLDAARERGVIP